MSRNFVNTIGILVVLVNSCLISAIEQNEKEAVNKLRNELGHFLVQDFMRTDAYLLRWIQESKSDLNIAKEKLLNALKWRRDNKIDNITMEDFSRVERFCTYTLDGHDKKNRPIITYPIGKCNFQRVVVSGHLPKFERLAYRIFEEFEHAVYKEKVDHGIIVIDYNGFTIRKHGCLRCLSFFVNLVQTYANYYPGILETAYLINFPTVAYQVANTLKPFISESLQNTFKFYGFDRSEWVPELLRIIDPDQLPVMYGGTRRMGKPK